MTDNTDLAQSNGPRLYQRAKQLIPGGTQLLSKRPEMFAPDLWPSYYEKAKGCNVVDREVNRDRLDQVRCDQNLKAEQKPTSQRPAEHRVGLLRTGVAERFGACSEGDDP